MLTVPRDSSSINADYGLPTRPTTTDPLWLSAVHYSAHAVTACIQSVVWGEVIINNDRGHFRGGGSDELLYSSRISEVRRGAAVRLAGGIAEFIATSNEALGARLMATEIAEWPDSDGASIDRRTTYSNVARVARGRFVPAMCCLVHDTFSIVHVHWPAIERIACELIKHGSVSVHRLRKIVCNGGAHVG